jgi:HAE1 family hydrophobic/amphiphilic exporter-1
MIAETFIKRPVTAIVISLVISIVGILAIMNLPVGQYPEITPPTVQVTGSFTGADAQTVEQTVTTPIETQINGTPGMTYMSSTSTSDGRSAITVNFELGTDINVATLDVQNRVSIAEPMLPEQVKRLGLTTRKRNPTILMLVAMYSPGGTHDVPFVDNYANIFVKDALLRVKGVGDIFSRADDFSMRIWLDPVKMGQMGISASEVTAALQEQNLQMAAGSIGAPPQHTTQTFEYTVFTNSRINSIEQFENIVIRNNPGSGDLLYLKDIARVQLGKFSYASNSFVDGKRAAYLLVYQAPGSNAIETAKGIVAKMEELKKSFPKDIDYIVPFESVTVVETSITEVVHTLVEALILVTLVVFLFLQSWRATLIPILAIPVSILGTFIFFLPLGFTINTLTMFGFVLAIGIVVDDAIVVVEAVQHYIDHEGLSAREATRKAMKDISAPVIAIALILAAVFVPVGFIPGLVGRLYQQFAITIAVSVLISAFVALTLTPALCSLLLKPSNISEKSKGLNRFFYKFNEWFRKLSLQYTIGVRKTIKASRYAIILLICLFVGTVFLFKAKPTGFIPTEDEGRLFVTYELPDASSTTRSIAVLDTIMHMLQETKGVKHFSGLGGLNVINFSMKPNAGTVFTSLDHWDERKDKSLQLQGIIDTLNKKFSAIKGARILVISPPAIPGLGQTGGFTFELQQRSSTDDIKQFEAVVNNFVAQANQRPELKGVFSFFTAKTPAYHVEVNREMAKQLGVNIADIYQTLQTFLGSSYVNDFTAYGRNFRVVAQADDVYRGDIKDLSKYYVKNSAGNMVPLSALADYKVIENAPVISHFNIFRNAEINGNAAPGYSSGQAIKALEEVAAQHLPEGYGYEFAGMSREELISGNSTAIIFSLSIAFVFLFLAALYESWSIPFSVLFAVPIGAFGAILTLIFLPKLTNNVYAQIGLITLIGLAAKNAILIVEYAKERVDKGIAVVPATLDAVKLRLRPIIMTSLAFILGILPLVFASGAGAISRQTIGWTVLGGMLAATLLAIFFVPVLFVVITKFTYGKKLAKQNASQLFYDSDED